MSSNNMGADSKTNVLILAGVGLSPVISLVVAYRQTAQLTVLDQFRAEEPHQPGFATRIADRIRTIFEVA
jgi:hypothetical protein